ncbi:MAG: hypothetical protein O9301_15690 [Leptospira sp.]|nr:hypothetical protein [Leptospira sp.]
MNIASLFVGFWKKPTLSADESKKEDLKKSTKAQLDLCESRLETLDILLTNDKIEDAKIILPLFFLDLVNLSRTIQGNEPLNNLPNPNEFLSSLQLSERQKRAFSVFTELEEILKGNAEKLEESLEKLYFVLSHFEKQFFKVKKEVLFTEYDRYKKTFALRFTALASIITIAFISYFTYAYKYPKFKNQSLKIYFLENKANQRMFDEKSISTELLLDKKGAWVEISLEVPTLVESFGALRIEPLRQRGIRFAIKDFQVFDAKGKILLERKFDIGENLLPNGYEDFLSFQDVKTVANLKPGDILEMDTTGSRPQFTLSNTNVLSPKSLKFKIRYLETYLAKAR